MSEWPVTGITSHTLAHSTHSDHDGRGDGPDVHGPGGELRAAGGVPGAAAGAGAGGRRGLGQLLLGRLLPGPRRAPRRIAHPLLDRWWLYF